MGLERRGDGRRLPPAVPVGDAGLADRGHAGADRQLAGDEVGASRRAACLGVVVGEHHALGGDLVEVRRAARHHAAVVGADVPDADVVAHDDDDVGPLRLRLRVRRIEQRDRHQRGRSDQSGARSFVPARNRHSIKSVIRHSILPWLTVSGA